MYSKKKRTYAPKRSTSGKKYYPKKRGVVKPATASPYDRSYIRSLVIPRSQMVKIKNSMDTYIPVGIANTQPRFATIFSSTLVQPFNTATPVNSTAASTGFNALITPGSGQLLTDDFGGYGFISQQYNSYKVYSASLKIKVRPDSSGDSILVGAFPWNVSNNVLLSSMELNDFQNQPFNKSIICHSQQVHTLQINMSSATILGLTKEQYRCALPGVSSIVSAPNANMGWSWFVYWMAIDGDTTAGKTAITFELERVVQFTNPNNLENI